MEKKEDNIKIDLICKAALMAFNTETLTWEDIKNKKYPIYEIAILDWNPKDHFDDLYAFTEIDNYKHEYVRKL